MKAPPTVKELIAELYERFPEFFEPKPCPTCEALSRTVMLDQTSHDRHKREWVGLTDEEVELVYEDVSGQSLRTQDYRLVMRFAYAIEAKLKELNHD